MKTRSLFLALLVSCLTLASCANREAGNESMDLRLASLEIRVELLEEAVGAMQTEPRPEPPEAQPAGKPLTIRPESRQIGPAPKPVLVPAQADQGRKIASPAPVPPASTPPAPSAPVPPAPVPLDEQLPALPADTRPVVTAQQESGPSLVPIGLPRADEQTVKAGEERGAAPQAAPGGPSVRRPEVITRPGIPAYYDEPKKPGAKPVPAARPAPEKKSAPQKKPASGLPNNLRSGNAEYDAALGSFYAREYGAALSRFGAFIEKHPNNKLIPNAMYWTGETLYSTGDFSGAIVQLKNVASKFPKHPKAADSLLKIGMAYEQLKDTENARFYWQILADDFPASSAGKLAKKRLAAL